MSLGIGQQPWIDFLGEITVVVIVIEHRAASGFEADFNRFKES
jgi:hypothetical protein